MAFDLKKQFEKLAVIEAERYTVFFAFFEPIFSEICDEMRAIKETQEKVGSGFDGLLKKNQLAEKLQLSMSTISKLQADGLPSVKCFKSVRFDYIEVLEWLKTNRKNEGDKEELRMVA